MLLLTTTYCQYAVGKSPEVEIAYDAFSKASELKCLRIVNKAVFWSALAVDIA